MIGRKALLIVVAKAISGILGFIGLFFLSRYFDQTVYGSIAWTLALVASFSSITDLGFVSAHLKRVSEGKDINECISTFAAVKLVLTVAMVVIVLLALLVWTVLLGNDFTDTSTGLILLFILYYVFYSISTIATTTFDAKMENAKTQISILLDPIVRIPLIAIVALNRGGVMELAYAYVIGGLAVMMASLFLLSRQRIIIQRPKMFKSYLTFAYPLAFVIIVSTLTANIDKVIVGFFWSATEVANYSGSQALLSLFGVVTAATITTTFPLFSRLFSSGDIETLRDVNWKAERYIIMILLPVVSVMVLFPTQIVTILLGGKYAGAGLIIQILCLTLPVSALSNIYSSQISAANRTDIHAKLTPIFLTISISLLLMLVPSSLFGFPMLGLGAVGAAVTSLVSLSIGLVIARYYAVRLVGIKLNKRIILQFIAAAIDCMLLYAVSLYWQIARWYDLVLFGFLSIAFFLAILTIMKEFHRADLKYFLDAINPKKMLSYVYLELRGKEKTA